MFDMFWVVNKNHQLDTIYDVFLMERNQTMNLNPAGWRWWTYQNSFEAHLSLLRIIVTTEFPFIQLIKLDENYFFECRLMWWKKEERRNRHNLVFVMVSELCLSVSSYIRLNSLFVFEPCRRGKRLLFCGMRSMMKWNSSFFLGIIRESIKLTWGESHGNLNFLNLTKCGVENGENFVHHVVYFIISHLCHPHWSCK